MYASINVVFSYFLTMTTKLTKTTSKGQITLPSEWRNQFDTDNFILEMDSKKIVIKPITIEEIASEEILFDANRDNQGKGIPVNEMIKLLKKLQNG